MKNSRHTIFFVAALMAASSCQKPIECPVPMVDRFEFSINAENYTAVSARTIANYGYNKRGIIIYRHNYENEMFAYDAACVDNAECLEQSGVRWEEDSPAMGKCQRCGSSYTLVDGVHTKKRLRLRPYSITRIANTTTQWLVTNR